ncbi:hypothetical protein N825_04875 [Skermanella stibiiresistens SB22]|uniref:Uncharacterized protein n=1 Tax=Skermanella stibiiresistens SB22 TaxID=1385369 RepID=W9H5D9_9PROT|nr:hypothetical protein N825_04875 [Skermanella stibiiresistens SB22]
MLNYKFHMKIVKFLLTRSGLSARIVSDPRVPRAFDEFRLRRVIKR